MRARLIRTPSPSPSTPSRLRRAIFAFAIASAAMAIACDGDLNGTEDQPCYGNGTCNDGLSCVDDLCVSLAGDEGEACYNNGTCNAGLVCESDVCVANGSEPAVEPGAEPGVEPDAEPSGGPGVEPEPVPEGDPGDCVGAAVTTDQALDNFQGDVIAWQDTACLPREVFLVRPDVQDPVGSYGGVARRFTYETAGGTRTNTSSNAVHPGFGEVVTHFDGGAYVSNRGPGAWRVVFEGNHHVIYEYAYTLPLPGGNVDATVWWIFATGRNHPLYAITYDASAAGPDAVNADTRSPYGDINFDGDIGGDVEGIGWGDRYRFRTTGAGPVTFSSPWTYAEENRIPHVISWSDSANAEMGLVQTQQWRDKDAGGYWFYTSWGTTSNGAPMPEDWNWTYQLNQYEIPFTTASHRVAWGSNYGAVGQRQYPVYGDDGQAVGYPYQSYSVFVALGERGEVDAVIGDTGAFHDATVSCATGATVQSAPIGAGRTDAVALGPNGYNPLYASFDLEASGGALDCSVDVGSANVAGLMFRVSGATSALTSSEVDVVSSYDASDDVTYVSVVGGASGVIRLQTQ